MFSRGLMLSGMVPLIVLPASHLQDKVWRGQVCVLTRSSKQGRTGLRERGAWYSDVRSPRVPSAAGIVPEKLFRFRALCEEARRSLAWRRQMPPVYERARRRWRTEGRGWRAVVGDGDECGGERKGGGRGRGGRNRGGEREANRRRRRAHSVVKPVWANSPEMVPLSVLLLRRLGRKKLRGPAGREGRHESEQRTVSSGCLCFECS